MKKKQKAQADKNQPNLYGEVDELYNLLSAHETADREEVEAAEKRVLNAEVNLMEAKDQLANTHKAMSIVERRRDELKPKAKKKEVVGAKDRIEGKRDKPEGSPPKPTPPPPKADVKKK